MSTQATRKFEKLIRLTSKIGSGATPSGGQSSYKDEGTSLIRSQNVLDFTFSPSGLAFIDDDQANRLNNVEVKENDVLLNITGDSIARVCKVPKNLLPARVNQHVAIIRSNGKIDPDYLMYYLIFRKNHLLTISRVGGTRNALTKEAIEKLEILLNKNDKKIAKVLSDLDTKIELNNRINAELEAMAKLVYEYWFVQFDFPVGFDSAQPPGSAQAPGKPYKSSGGKMVWNEELKREIPEGWEVHPVDYWIQNDKNGDWGKEEIEGNYDLRVSCIRGADINGLNGNGELKSPVRYILEKNIHKILEPGDLVIEISGGSPTQSTGRLGYIINETLERFSEPLICSNFCKAITLKDESNLFNFIYEWKRLYDAGIFFGYEGKTSGIKNFLFESFVSKHKIVIPPQELTEMFYEKVLPIHSKIQKNLIQNQELSSLRDWLLPMLMNGQVSVAEAEEQVQEELGMVAER